MNNPDHQTTKDIDDRDDDTRDRVTTNEFRGTIHGSVKICFLFNLTTTLTCVRFVDRACVQLGIDRHLLTWHRIQSETCSDFGYAPRTLGDDDEVDDDQDHEHDKTDDVIATDDEITEGLDHVTGSPSSFMTMS
ncbi:hypothetical protein D3C72_1858080 [compost metagenome]